MEWALPVAAVLMCSSFSTPAAGDNYLAHLLSTLSEAGSNLTALTRSAEGAATRFIAGSKLWVAGRQEDFIAEACGRAGGLVDIAALGDHVPDKGDVVLYAVPGALNPEDQKLMNHWQGSGTMVIIFRSSAGLYRGLPVDTVMNVLDLWTWAGEFVAACTRSGKMPVLFQSYGLPGGRERARRYQGKRFHDDLAIEPIPPEVLGREYRRQIERMLRNISNTETSKIVKGAKWWREATTTSLLFTGHMFPRHVQDLRATPPGNMSPVPAWKDKELLDPRQPPSCVVYVGYQFAPRQLITQAKQMGVKLIYFDVEPDNPPEPASNILYINPQWPLADGCVNVRAYDIAILPASGVVDAAIYWTLRDGSVPR